MTPQQLRDQIEDNELEFHRALNTLKYRKMTWAKNAKRRPYTDNILLNSVPLLQQWVLRTYANVEDMRLQFLESDQKKKLASEEEIVASREGGGNTIDPTVRRLYLPDAINTPSYWKQKRLDVQAWSQEEEHYHCS